MIKAKMVLFFEKLIQPTNLSEPGRVFDVGTYRGNFNFFIFSCASIFFFWNFDEIFSWYQKIKGNSGYIIDVKRQGWIRFLSVIIWGSSILFSVWFSIMITLNRRRAQKSAKGQWYDTQSLKPEDLVSDIPEDCSENTEPVQDDSSLPEFRTWKEDPQEPIGIAPPAEAQSPHQFGDARLEMKNGDAVLLVKRNKK